MPQQHSPNAFSVRHPNLYLALSLLADDNGLRLRDTIDLPNSWVARAQSAEAQASELRDKQLRDYKLLTETDSKDADDDDDALEYIANGEASVVERLVETARAHDLHALLNAAFDGELHTTMFVSRRMRHAR